MLTDQDDSLAWSSFEEEAVATIRDAHEGGDALDGAWVRKARLTIGCSSRDIARTSAPRSFSFVSSF